MPYDPLRHHRRSIRLPGYDYSQNGAYFITLNVQQRACVLGSIENGVMHVSALGLLVAETWTWLADQYEYVSLGAWVVMPDHLHGIIQLRSDTGKVKPLGQIIGAFKTVSTKRINAALRTPGTHFW